MNLTTLQTWTSQFTGDPGQTRYSTSKYLNALNEAQVQFAIDSLALFKDQIYSVVAGTSSYALPSDFMFEKKATISTINNTDAGKVLTFVSRADIEFYTVDRDWTQDNGTPRFAIIDPETARNDIILYPNPQGADAGTNNFRLTYYPYPTALVNGTDVPLNSTTNLIQFHIAIAAYAAWLLLGLEVMTPEMKTKRDDLYKQYQLKVTEARDKYGTSSQEPWRFKGGRIWH